ncbi:putative bifunctional diguanylate cyclase/phosphodiesterase [Gorillibacterium massiliense]|uniref:putative bifunctional diguanylate cyclase/phosphodiesterase n=1 Tax=Gorillibacterium massiliense TaxID=1280390 RepID=UPI0004B50381|nr:EAL domain-containing protein [Gorillibacterium massiliense]
MSVKTGKTFSIGHLLISGALGGYYLQTEDLRPELGYLFILSFLWAGYLIAHTFWFKRIDPKFRQNFSRVFLLVDCFILTAIYLLPDWHSHTYPAWIMLITTSLYAYESGVSFSSIIGACGLADYFLMLLIRNKSIPLLDTLLFLSSVMLIVFIVGRRTDILKKLTFKDPLTRLTNRETFKEDLQLAILKQVDADDQIGLLFLDLDQFKYVNDTIGHSTGDLLLQMVSDRLKSSIPGQANLARMGGDEFAIMLTGIRHSDVAASLAETIVDIMKASFPLNKQEIFISCSIGIAMFPEDGSDADTLMKNADTALYRAKEHGRNNFQFYTPLIHTKGHRRLQMETMLRHALERNEFVLVYQPRLDPATGKLVCVEALVRWKHPELGILPPSEFISLAEDTGLIVSLGEQVLRNACTQRTMWTKAGLPDFRVSVNLSARQFRQTDLPEVIFKVLQDTGLEPRFLELEITESAAMEDVHFAILMLRVLKEMELMIAIDDFGTGYSSLSYLKRLPIDVIKIDRSFINGIEKEDDDAAIVRTIIAMAQTLKLQVTAEGVESSGQLDFLKHLKCDEIQGYHIGRPMPPDEFENWYARSIAV